MQANIDVLTASLNAPTPPSPDSQGFNIGCNDLTNSFQVSLFIIHSAFSRSFVCFCSFEFKYRINRNTVSLRCYHYVCIIYNGYEFFTNQCKVLALQALDELSFPTFIAHVALETFLIKQAGHQTSPNMEHQIM